MATGRTSRCACVQAHPAARMIPLTLRLPCLPSLLRLLQDKLPGDMEGLAESFERLQHSLQQAQAYVDAVVVSGRATLV